MIRAYKLPGCIMLMGHAGSAPKGEDLVCAAVSVLAETLRASLPPESSLVSDGFAAFFFPEPCPEAEFVYRGLLLLAKAYPEAVCLRRARR